MSRYFWVDYYQGLIKSAPSDSATPDKEVANRNKMICDTAFPCPDIFASLTDKESFSLWTTYPGLMMGTGYTHDGGLKGDICAGFTFDYVTGLPYLPGSSVKGILRSAFKHPAYIQELIEDNTICVDDLERALFGERPKGATQMPPDGKVTFLDVFPAGSCDKVSVPGKEDCYRLLGLDAITPHHTGELGPLAEPVPLTFLKLMPGVEMKFCFIIPKSIRYGQGMSIDAPKVRELFTNILLDLGVGAKTNVGFGQLTDKKPTPKPVSKPANRTAAFNVRPTSPTPQKAQEGICKICGKPTGKKASGGYYDYCSTCNPYLNNRPRRK